MDKYNYNNWTYIKEHNNQRVEHPKTIPNDIYKYYPNNKYSRDAILNQYIFCSHPYHLNDSIDCSPLIWDFSKLAKPLYEKFYKEYELDKIFDINYDSEKENGFENTKQFFFDLITNDFGIISLSEDPLNALMWAHYTNEKGFLVNFEWKEIQNNLKGLNENLKNYVFFPIQYVKNIEKINFFSESFTSPDVPFLYSTAIKRKIWSYENEWRLLVYSKNFGVPNSKMGFAKDHIGTQDRKINYPISAIKSIILGKHYFDNYLNIDEKKYSFESKIHNKEDYQFITFLINNFNDKVFLGGEIEDGNILKRSTERIEMQDIGNQTIKIIRKHEGFF